MERGDKWKGVSNGKGLQHLPFFITVATLTVSTAKDSLRVRFFGKIQKRICSLGVMDSSASKKTHNPKRGFMTT